VCLATKSYVFEYSLYRQILRSILTQHSSCEEGCDGIGPPQNLFECQRSEDHAEAFVCQLSNMPVYLGSGADINATGGLLHNEKPKRTRGPLSKCYFLLVATAEGVGRQSEGSVGDSPVVSDIASSRAFAFRPYQDSTIWPPEVRGHQVLPHRAHREDSIELPVIRAVADPGPDCVSTTPQYERLPVEMHRSSGRRSNSDEEVDHCIYPATDIPSQSDDLTCSDGQRHLLG